MNEIIEFPGKMVAQDANGKTIAIDSYVTLSKNNIEGLGKILAEMTSTGESKTVGTFNYNPETKEFISVIRDGNDPNDFTNLSEILASLTGWKVVKILDPNMKPRMVVIELDDPTNYFNKLQLKIPTGLILLRKGADDIHLETTSTKPPSMKIPPVELILGNKYLLLNLPEYSKILETIATQIKNKLHSIPDDSLLPQIRQELYKQCWELTGYLSSDGKVANFVTLKYVGRNEHLKGSSITVNPGLLYQTRQ